MVGSAAHALNLRRQHLLTIVQGGIRAADAGRLLSRALWARGVAASYGRATANARSLRGIAAGKAAAVMARTAAEYFGPRLRDLVVADPSNAGHPVPTAGSERQGRLALAAADALSEDEALLVLLSGGASALMAVPAEGVSLDEKRAATARLLREGADISALNAVRKHLSAIKGGRLAVHARGRCVTFAVSDVVGDDPSVIASGPTVGDPSTYADALHAVDTYGGRHAYPQAVVRRLVDGVGGRAGETPKPGDPRLARSEMTIVGSRHDAMRGAADEARALGYEALVVEAAVTGEARLAAPAFVAALADRAAAARRPLCIVASGETTVRVRGRGMGGRNQEFALAAAAPIGRLGGTTLLASVGTDGVDGPTEAAGAVVDPTTIARARDAGLPPIEQVLDDNDSHTFFRRLGDLVLTGATGTNVGDLQVVLLA